MWSWELFFVKLENNFHFSPLFFYRFIYVELSTIYEVSLEIKSTFNNKLFLFHNGWKVEENVSAPRVARFISYAFLAFFIRFLIVLF